MKAIEKVLGEILDGMDVPAMRKELTTPNLRWLQRNLFIRNKDKDSFPSAVHFIATLLTMRGEDPRINLDVGLTQETITPQKAAELLGQEPPLKDMNRSRN